MVQIIPITPKILRNEEEKDDLIMTLTTNIPEDKDNNPTILMQVCNMFVHLDNMTEHHMAHCQQVQSKQTLEVPYWYV